MRTLLVLSLLLAVIVGCGEKSADPSQAKEAGKTATAAEPSPGGSESQLKSAYEKAKAAYAAKSQDEKLKVEYVQATVSYATAVMSGDGAPKDKYPRALELYDEALAIDPKNGEAKVNRQLILDIYEQMGKEPPKPKGK
ncbi:MAG: hypothetical protein AKCLJLPJ_02069 [Fimbriimonadales bacterium]|nr:hypothetical protein [Fimbriimonadales bacterium]